MDLTQLWDRTLHLMRDSIGHQDVAIWLRAATPLELDQGVLRIRVPNRYYADWISGNYQEELTTSFIQALGHPVRLKFTWPPEGTEAASVVAEPTVDDDDNIASGAPINALQTFDTFVIGECNKFAHAAASAVADHPATQYNPLFIYGSTGLGKTHLMHAVANRVLATHPGARVVYVTVEDFMNEMINCIRYKRMDDFRNKYRHRSAVLLVDDVQFLSGKDATQEEFFHTFNALQSSGKQIVLSADVVPKDIDKLEPRLRTRFEGGLLADMQPPNKETLHAILRQKADVQRLRLPDDLAEVLASRVAGNIRELEGVLNRISALCRFYREPVTLDWARQRLPDVFDPPRPNITVSHIIEAVAKLHNVRSADITGKRRTRNLTRPRHIAMFLAREHTTLSYPELGREFGGRDHSTIQHGFRKVQEQLEGDPDLAHKVRLIEQTLQVRPRA